MQWIYYICIVQISQFLSRDIWKKGGEIETPGCISLNFHGIIAFLILIFFSGDCCNRVRGWYLAGEQNNSWDEKGEHFGYYDLQRGIVNGKAYYISADGESAIWFDPTGVPSWMVGKVKNQGTAYHSLSVQSTADCPTEPTYDWVYLDQYRNFRDADKGFSIYCKD